MKRASFVRYPVFAMLFAFAFMGDVQRSSVSVAAERMMPELDRSQVRIGWLFTASLIAYAVFQIPTALIGRVLGARRILAIIAIIGVLGSLLTAATPWVAAAGVLFVTLLLARLLLGVAQAALIPITVGGRLADHFHARFGDRIGMRIVPLVAAPCAPVFRYLTVRSTRVRSGARPCGSRHPTRWRQPRRSRRRADLGYALGGQGLGRGVREERGGRCCSIHAVAYH